MTGTLSRMVAAMYGARVLAVGAAVLVIFLVGDFADRLKAYLAHPLGEVAFLYWNKLLVAVYQLAPAAMLLAASATGSTLRQRGEWTAMQALGLSRAAVVRPVLALAIALSGFLLVFQERVVSVAGPKVDDMMAITFHRWGDFRFHYVRSRWARVGERVVFSRGQDGAVLTDVTIFTVDERFEVRERIDASTMEWAGEERWSLGGVVQRHFAPPADVRRETLPSLVLHLPGTGPLTFTHQGGRPEYIPFAALVKEAERRRQVGLKDDRLVLEQHNRFASPLTGVVATVVALLLALRPGRRGHLTLALVEGLVVIVALFTLVVVGRALALGEHLSPAVAAWTPVAGLAVVAAALLYAADGPLTATGRRPADRPAPGR